MAVSWPWRWLLLLLATSVPKTNKDSSNSNGTVTDDGSNDWFQVKELEQMDSKQLKQFIAPLIELANNAYKYPNDAPVGDWRLAAQVDPLAPSSAAGAHAVAYESNSSKKVVVAFRGTSTQADICADVFLFGDKPPAGMVLPSSQDCAARYSNSSLDYVYESVNYTRMVMKAYPDSALLLTGHSLGAALAVAVSALLSVEIPVMVPVVAFSAPGTKQILRGRSIEVAEEWGKQAFVFGDEWDAVVNSFWGEQIGTICLFKHKQSAECSQCSKSGDSNSCSECLFQSHGLDNLLRLLDAAVQPSCESKL